MTVGKILLGCLLLLVLLQLTILQDDTPPPPAVAASSTTVVFDPTTVPVGVPAMPTASPTPLQRAEEAGGFLAVAAAVDQLNVYNKPAADGDLVKTFPKSGETQISSTFLAVGEEEGPEGDLWFNIRLPMRPNGSTGWVKADEVAPGILTHSMTIDLSDHQLTYFERGRKAGVFPVGLGKDNTPTPIGDYYVAVRIQPASSTSVYGVFILGLSGFSEVLTDWPGDGQLAIHGTNDPTSVGKGISLGCIRLQNADIIKLAGVAPLGTPVRIQE